MKLDVLYFARLREALGRVLELRMVEDRLAEVLDRRIDVACGLGRDASVWCSAIQPRSKAIALPPRYSR